MLTFLTEGIAGCTGVQDNDDGTYTVHVSGQPDRLATAAEILAATKLGAITANRAEARRRIEAKYPLWRQQSAVLGVYPEVYAAQMAADIASVVSAENAAADLIDACATVAQVEAVQVNWPSF